MLRRFSNLTSRRAGGWLNFGAKNKPNLDPAAVQAARTYIADYWAQLERYHPQDEISFLGLPKPYLVSSYEPDQEFNFNELYYWDSYFVVQGMLDEQHKLLVLGILENLVYLFKRFGVIPNASRTYLTGRSQPPLLTSFIFDVYYAYRMDKKWLAEHMAIAKAEYHTVWMGTKKPNARLVHKGLSRYYDINYTQDLAEAESGWDYTSRFNRRCLMFLPVDLNALLYKYETDFAEAARILGDPAEVGVWHRAARHRKRTMDRLMWSKARGLYYDYNYYKQRRGSVASLAAFYPLWAGMVDADQAARLVRALRRFERKGGLVTTENPPIGRYAPGALPLQWVYPNGWAPLHFLVVKGLQRYGYHADARRIAEKWLRTNLDWFTNHHQFLEKYNVVNPDKLPVSGVYPPQIGFGWTNAVFERFCQEFVDTQP